MERLTVAECVRRAAGWPEPVNTPVRKYRNPSIEDVAFVPVNSSNVYGIRFFDRTMEVHFNNEWVYRYEDVPPALFVDFISARSKGGFFNTYVRGMYHRSRRYWMEIPGKHKSVADEPMSYNRQLPFDEGDWY